MRIASRIILLVGPLLALPTAGMLYTHLNIGKRMFVERLGCGCGPFFNTNHLNLGVSGVLLATAAISWWLAGRGLSRNSLWALASAFGVLGLLFFRQFMYYNLWL